MAAGAGAACLAATAGVAASFPGAACGFVSVTGAACGLVSFTGAACGFVSATGATCGFVSFTAAACGFASLAGAFCGLSLVSVNGSGTRTLDVPAMRSHSESIVVLCLAALNGTPLKTSTTCFAVIGSPMK